MREAPEYDSVMHSILAFDSLPRIDLAYLAEKGLYGARLSVGEWYTGATIAEAQQALERAITLTVQDRAVHHTTSR